MGMNDDAWECLFAKYNILEKIDSKGQYTISADQIREFREPRLMTKFDHKVNLATVYKGNIIKNLIMDCQSYTKYRPNETTGGIFVSWRRKEELPTGA